MLQVLDERACRPFSNGVPLVRADVLFDQSQARTSFLCLLDTGSICTRLTHKGMEKMKELGFDPETSPHYWKRVHGGQTDYQLWNSCVGFFFERGPGLLVNGLYYFQRFYKDGRGQDREIANEYYEIVIGRDLMQQTIFEYRGLENLLRLLTL